MSCDSATWEKTGGKEKPEKRRENVSETREPSEHQDWKQVRQRQKSVKGPRGRGRMYQKTGESHLGATLHLREQGPATAATLYQN